MDNEMHLYWNKWYEKDKAPLFPSSFAEFCLSYISEGNSIIDLGCGNGRDSLFFGHNGFDVMGIDYSEIAISHNKKANILPNINFGVADFADMGDLGKFSCIYSRFSFHAVDILTEKKLILWCGDNLLSKELFFLEARSTKDPLMKLGKKISPTENYTDHYRRFLDYDETQKYLEDVGFKLIYSIEANGLAKYKDDDPVVIRIVAEKI